MQGAFFGAYGLEHDCRKDFTAHSKKVLTILAVSGIISKSS